MHYACQNRTKTETKTETETNTETETDTDTDTAESNPNRNQIRNQTEYRNRYRYRLVMGKLKSVLSDCHIFPTVRCVSTSFIIITVIHLCGLRMHVC